MRRSTVVLMTVVLAGMWSCSSEPPFADGEYHLYENEEGREKILTLYNESLSLLKIPFSEVDVETSFGKTHIIITGKNNARPLVLLHGSSANSSSWIYNMEALGRNNRLYAIDINGHPGKSRLTKLFKEPNDYAQWLDEVFKRLQIKEAAIVGWSYGGFAAQWYLHAHPDKVRRLVLLANSYVDQQPDLSFVLHIYYYILFPSLEKARKEVEWINGGPINDSYKAERLAEFIHYQNLYGNPNVISPYTSVPLESIRSSTVPVLILMGDRDVVFDARKAQAYCKKINNPHIRFEIISGSGHLLPVDRPGEINALIQGFLE